MNKAGKRTHFSLLCKSAVVSLLLGVFFSTGCGLIKGENREKLYSKQDTGRQDGSGIPDKMLKKVMAVEGETHGQKSRGTRVFNALYKQAFKAVRKTITSKEYPILKNDIKTGLIESGYRPHDGLFALGFLGGRIRSKMVAKLTELEPKRTEIILEIFTEKEGKDGLWQQFPVTDYDLDLIDSDSIDIYFHNISKRLNPQVPLKN